MSRQDWFYLLVVLGVAVAMLLFGFALGVHYSVAQDIRSCL